MTVNYPKKVLQLLLISLGLAAGLTFISSQFGLVDAFEHWTGDFRAAFLSPRADTQHGSVALVLIDERTLELDATDFREPTDRYLLARVRQVIDQASPKAIGLDFIFDQSIKGQDALLEAIHEAHSPIVLEKGATAL